MDYRQASGAIYDRVIYRLSYRYSSPSVIRDKQDILLIGWDGYELMRWKPDRSIIINLTHRPGWCDRSAINSYNPFRHMWWLYPYRGRYVIGDPSAGDRNRSITNGKVIKYSKVVIDRDGNISNRQLESFEKLKRKKQQEDYLLDKPRRRGRYWVKKARGVTFDRTKCTETIRWQCYSRRWNRTWPTVNTTYPCGCTATVVPHNFKGTVQSIMEERNATVRSAMIKMYGIEKFFKDAGSQEIDTHKKYSLLNMDIAATLTREPLRLRALRMVCPSTGTTYIQGVPANTSSVSSALDWIYNTNNYLETVGKQT